MTRYSLEHQKLAQELARRQQFIRFMEVVALMAAELLCGAVAYVATYHWTDKSRGLLLSGVAVALLVAWLGVRTLLGASPIILDDNYYNEMATKALTSRDEPADEPEIDAMAGKKHLFHHPVKDPHRKD